MGLKLIFGGNIWIFVVVQSCHEKFTKVHNTYMYLKLTRRAHSRSLKIICNLMKPYNCQSCNLKPEEENKRAKFPNILAERLNESSAESDGA
jgi:hypothetical protein